MSRVRGTAPERPDPGPRQGQPHPALQRRLDGRDHGGHLLLGAAFWWVAAHYFSQDSVGVASAAVSAMTLLGFMATLGLGTLLMGELPRRERSHRSVINAALLITWSLGAALGLAFALIAPLALLELRPARRDLAAAAFFAIGVGLTALAFVLDQALIGLLRGGLQLPQHRLHRGQARRR